MIFVDFAFHEKKLCISVHEPKWSLILGCWGAFFGFGARAFATHYMIDDRNETLRFINETLDMKKIEHLAPRKAEANVIA